MSASSGASIRDSNSISFQKPGVENALLSKAVASDKAAMTRLLLAALSGTISAMATIFTTVIDWKVLGWRNFWLAVCIAGFLGLITFIWMAVHDFTQ